MVSVHPARRRTSPRGVGSGDGVGDCHDVDNLPRVRFFISLLYLFWGENFTLSLRVWFSYFLRMLVAKWEPTPCYRDTYSADSPKWACWGQGWQNHCKTTFSPLFGRFFLVSKRTIFFFFFFGRVIVWMFHIGRARHPGPGQRFFTPGQLSVEFVNVGGWLTHVDLALDSCAQFLAVAEHRLILSGDRSICHQLRKAGQRSGWSPACQDQVAGGHAGLGLLVLLVPPLLSPSLLLLSSRSFSGWARF